MQTHTQSSIIIHAPITVVWQQLWQNFLQQNEFTKGTNIKKSTNLEIERTVSVDEKSSRREKITKVQKEKTLKNLIVGGDVFGEIKYELEQTPKGEVVLKMKSNVIDQNKKPFPSKAFLDHELQLHKELIEHKYKHPKKKGVCC